MSDITIDIRESGIVINGNAFSGKIYIDDLKPILGEPRSFELEPDKNLLEALEQKFGKGNVKVTKYTWDDLGIYCNTDDGKLLVDLGIALNNKGKTAPQTPKSNFKGIITIDGNNWLTEMQKGKDHFQMYYNRKYANYYLFAEYFPETKENPNKTEEDFTIIEIILEKVNKLS